MKFEKTSEQIIRFENFSGHLLIREFQYDEQPIDPIAEFMKTRYFSWQEEFRNEVKATINGLDQLVDWNFHGIFDIKKLRSEHFKAVTAYEFVDHFKETLLSEIGIDKNQKEAQNLLNKLIDLKSGYYLIRNLPDDLRHEWTVYDFFLSGFKINKDQKILIAVECGLD